MGPVKMQTMRAHLRPLIQWRTLVWILREYRKNSTSANQKKVSCSQRMPESNLHNDAMDKPTLPKN